MNVDNLIEQVLKIDEISKESSKIARKNKINFSYNVYRSRYLCEIMYKNIPASDVEEFLLKLMPYMPNVVKYGMFNNLFNLELEKYYGVKDLISDKIWQTYVEYIAKNHRDKLFIIMGKKCDAIGKVKKFIIDNFPNEFNSEVKERMHMDY